MERAGGLLSFDIVVYCLVNIPNGACFFVDFAFRLFFSMVFYDFSCFF